MSTDQSTITIEQIEALADKLQHEDGDRRAKLLRMIRAYVRILAIREPAKFTRRATIYADEDGHYDNSYPPKQEWKKRTGPKSITFRQITWETRSTTGGFYYDYDCYTTVVGLCIDKDGDWYAGTLEGTGQYGQFAAHPGECSVECTIEWDEFNPIDLTTEEISDAEQHLRVLAFPASAAKENGGAE